MNEFSPHVEHENEPRVDLGHVITILKREGIDSELEDFEECGYDEIFGQVVGLLGDYEMPDFIRILSEMGFDTEAWED